MDSIVGSFPHAYPHPGPTLGRPQTIAFLAFPGSGLRYLCHFPHGWRPGVTLARRNQSESGEAVEGLWSTVVPSEAPNCA